MNNNDRNPWKFCSRVRNVAKVVAGEYGVDAYAVMEAAVALQRQERETMEELVEARRMVRKETGLSMERIYRLEDSGKDHTAVADLDCKARSLAREFPALGLGRGFEMESNFDGVDHAALLWELLRKADPVIRSQHDESLVREAAELVKGQYDEVPF